MLADANTAAVTLDPAQLGTVRLLLAGMCWPLQGFPRAAEAESIARDGALADGTPWGDPQVLQVPATPALREALRHPPARCLLRDPEGAPVAVLLVTEAIAEGGGLRLAGTLQTPDGQPCAQPAAAGAALAWAVEDCLHAFAADLLAQRLAEDRARDLLVLRAARGHGTASLQDFVDAEASRRRAARLSARAGCAVRIVDVPSPAGTPAAVTRALAVLAANLGAAALLVADDAAGTVARIPLRPVGAPGAVLAAHDHRAIRAALASDAPHPGLDDAGIRQLLSRAYPPRGRQGFCVLLTGLSGAGKSTIARHLSAALLGRLLRPVSLLDGDVVRLHLSSGLGFDRASREANLARLAFVAREICQAGGIVICAPIAPYAASRARMRAVVEEVGGFVEIHVATPLLVCEQRDPKGLYARARAGQLATFTGIDDPYEEPASPDLRIDTSALPLDTAVARIVAQLAARGYLGAA
jgi:sulfate adenylyltransferase